MEKQKKRTISDQAPEGTKTMNFNEIYKFEPQDIVPDITVSRYSNVAYIQVTQRDVYIDFLEMPGIKRDGKMMVNGTRIYMSHVAAQQLAGALGNVLNQVHMRGDMERFGLTGGRGKKIADK
jgi:hypothetical protein